MLTTTQRMLLVYMARYEGRVFYTGGRGQATERTGEAMVKKGLARHMHVGVYELTDSGARLRDKVAPPAAKLDDLEAALDAATAMVATTNERPSGVVVMALDELRSACVTIRAAGAIVRQGHGGSGAGADEFRRVLDRVAALLPA